MAPARCVVAPLDLNALAAAVPIDRKGEFRLKALSAYMTTDHLVDEAAAAWELTARRRRTLCFACDKAHAAALADAIHRRGGRVALLLSGQKDAERRAALRGFASGHVNVLVNCMIATEGTDIPACDCVMMLRPTRSLSLYLQVAGRAARVDEGKRDYLFLDCAGVVGLHGIPSHTHPWTLTPHEPGSLREFDVFVRPIRGRQLVGEARWVAGTSLTPEAGVMYYATGSRARPARQEVRNWALIRNSERLRRRNGYKAMWAVHKYLMRMRGANATECRELGRVFGVNPALVMRISRERYGYPAA